MANSPASDKLVSDSQLYELFNALSASVAPCLSITIDSRLQISAAEGDCWAVFGVEQLGPNVNQELLSERLHPADRPIIEGWFATPQSTPRDNHLRIRNGSGQLQIYQATFAASDDHLQIELSDTREAARQIGAATGPITRAVLETTDDFIFAKDAHHVLLTASQSMATLCEPVDHWTEFAGKSDYEVFPEELADDYYRLETEVYAGKKIAREVQRFERTDGTTGWVDNRKYPVTDDQGNMIGLFGIARDITEQVNAAQALSLSASVFEHAAERIVILDTQGRIIQGNHAFLEHVEMTAPEVVGQPLAEVQRASHHLESFDDVFPILRDAGEWQGEFHHTHDDGSSYVELARYTAVRDSDGVPHHYVGLHSDITGLKHHAEELEHLAQHDELTGLANRSLLGDRMGQAIAHAARHDSSLAVAYIDIDGFKQVNDSRGHDVGDLFLRGVADAMQAVLRDTDTLARIGGDEFVAVITDIEHDADYIQATERLREAAARAVSVGDERISCTASIGLALYPQDGVEADLLMRRADLAMYRAKREGKDTVHLFGQSHRKGSVSRERLEEALNTNEFELYYQPKINLFNGELVGLEALARWNHPEKGLLSPGDFLDDIDRENLDIPFGEWVIDTAIAQLKSWRESNLHVPISINISGMHLKRAGFIESVETRLRSAQLLGTGALEIEVLESSEIDDLRKVKEVIRDGAHRGIEFALDDFGTGFSSLTNLRQLPVNTVKIDKSFVEDMLHDDEDRAIVGAIIAVCRGLGRRVIAEGVCSMAHARELAHMGCINGQGFGIAMPMAAEDFPTWQETWASELPHWRHRLEPNLPWIPRAETTRPSG